MVTFDDRIQTFARPQSMHDSELSYNDDGRHQPHQPQHQQQQQSVVKKDDEESDVNRDAERTQRDRQGRHDVQSQQTLNESDIYEDVYARQNSLSAEVREFSSINEIPCGVF